MSGASAEPPPATAPPEWKYDVFVSFRGGDARKGFISHLFRAFEQAEIRCYRDDRDRRGLIVARMLLDAIRTSRTTMVHFTTRYADSGWCLDELVEIMKCDGAVYRNQGHMMVPIFYDVEPSDVRRQSGEFGRGLERSVAAEEGEAKATAWRAALEAAGNRSGWHLMNDANGDEALLIEKIVGQIVSQSSFANSAYFIRDAVGIDESASALISLLNIGSDDVRVIGLYGIEGIGKTTLAKLACSRAYSKFEGVSFLEDIGDATYDSIVKFQKTIIDDVVKSKRPVLDDYDYNHNLGLIRDKLCNKKILLVLDNVVEKIQVRLLLGGRGGLLGRGSRILITTRNKGLLDDLKVDSKFVVSGLGLEESFQLFNRDYALEEDDEEEGSEELSRALVHYAGGLPLAIKTLRSCLFGRSREERVKLLEHLVQNPNLDWIKAYSVNRDSFLRPYKSMVEPFGGPDGSSYDDKGYNGIRRIQIVVAEGMVRSICIDYDHNGSLVRSSWHGTSGGLLCTVTLDYPDEFLTSISGCINDDLHVIQSLTIHTNWTAYGPYGDENENNFSFQEKHTESGKIIGFYGKCSSHLNSLGAYFGPVSHPYPFKTIGPFGHEEEDCWDDGRHADIRQIDVVFGSVVESISVIYDNYGHSTIPFLHGEHSGGKSCSVSLAYPYEYLTCISGYLREHLGRLFLQSVSFHSNTTKYGPFGEEDGLPFSGPSTGGKIVGFYGSCNSHLRLQSIGAYLEPVSHKHPLRQIGPFGGNGGGPWDDRLHSGLKQFVIRCGTFVDSIKFFYDYDDGTSTETSGRGGDGGEHLRTVILEYPDEYLVSMSGFIGRWGHMHLVNSLKFQSNRRVYGPYGSEQGTYFSSPPNIGEIVGFYGRSGIYLDCIGAYFTPKFHMDPAKSVGPYGGVGGGPWDDGRHTDVRRILISYGVLIDGISVIYDDSGNSTHHGGHGGSSLTIELEYPQEYLTSMSGQVGNFSGMELVRSLTFQSNKRVFGPFGTSGGTPFSSPLTSGKIVGFHGRSGLYLDSIGVHLDLFHD